MSAAGVPLLVLWPLLAAPGLWFLRRLGPAAMGWWVAGVAGVAFALTAALTPAVLAHGRIAISVPAVLGHLEFALDGVGLAFALIATFVWTASSVYAIDYLVRDGRERRYHLTSLSTLAAMLGIVTAGDLITLYVSFEWLGLVGYLFVVHAGGRDAERAGLKYLILTLLGGFGVLTGLLLVHGLGGGDLHVALALEPGQEGLRALAAVLLVAGFGVKAGVLGLHVWLPDAHTAAPAPASALLSGLLIKAGAYGILRTVGGLYGPGAAPGAAAAQGEAVALAVLLLGSATMLAGVVMALWQHEAKRLLAYSSVSQMGFILVGIGSAGLLGAGGAIGWTGALLHVVNHALFKSLLFLGMGAVIHATGVGDLRRLGGLARRMPWTFAFVLVAVGGIAGLPGLNGFVSKSIVHHALEYAEHATHLGILVWAERVFTLTTVGTAAALLKLVVLAFLGRPRSELPRQPHEATWGMRAAMATLAVAIVAIGLRPQAWGSLLARASEAFGAASDGVAKALASPIGHAGDLRAAATALVLGAALFALVQRTRVLDRPPPAWASWDRILAQTLRAVWAAVRWLADERAAVEAAARRLLAHEREVLIQAAARPPTWGRRAWLKARVAALATAERLGAHWQVAERVTREIGRRLDESRRLDEQGGEALLAARIADRAATLEDPERFMRSARRRIQRDTRDLSLNVGVLFLVWLAFLGTLVAFTG